MPTAEIATQTDPASDGRPYMPASKTAEHSTPPMLFRWLDERFHFTLDAAASHEHHLCDQYFTAEDDALKQEWTSVVYCNPPYGPGLERWVQKAVQESGRATVVMLLPVRASTRWFHRYVLVFADEVIFIQGRLHFDGSRYSAPFASMIVVFSPKAYARLNIGSITMQSLIKDDRRADLQKGAEDDR